MIAKAVVGMYVHPMKGLPQTLLAGAGALFCFVGAWLAFHVFKATGPIPPADDSYSFMFSMMEAQARFTQFTFSGVLFLIGAVFIVGACVVAHLDRDERR